MHIFKPYRQVLGRRDARRPLTANLVGRIPESIVSIALLLLAESSTGSWKVAGVVAAAFGLGSAVGAPLAGKVLDRRGQSRVLPAMAVAFAASLIAILAASARHAALPLVVFSGVAGLVRPPLETAMRALWPALVERRRLQAAYALDATLQELVWIGGPLLLSVALALNGPGIAVAGCAVVSVGATGLYAASARAFPPVAARDGSRAPLSSMRFSALLTASSLYGVAVGVLVVALTAFCASRGEGSVVGVAIAVWGFGSL